MRSFRKNILVSLILHGILIGFFLSVYPESERKPDFIEIQMVERKENSFGAVGLRLKKRSQSSESFFPSYSLAPVQEALVDKNAIGSSNEERRLIGKTWEDDFSYSQDFETIAKHSPRSAFYRELFRRIDSHLLFESILAEYNHFGEVYFQFAVNPDGTLISQTLRASAKDRVLKVFAARALRSALIESLPQSLQLSVSGPIWMAARFFYKGRGGCNPSKVDTAWLTFCRWTSEHPTKNSLLDHLIESSDAKLSFPEKDPLAPGPVENKISAVVVIPLDAWAQQTKRKQRKNLDFDPFLKEKKDPDWEL